MPTRIDGDLFEAAKAAGQVHSRSAAQQIDHWARIGRELEAAPAVTHDLIARVLTGRASYDVAGDRAQAVIRAAWDEEIGARIAGLDFTERLDASGTSWAEADDDGRIIEHAPAPASGAPLDEPAAPEPAAPVSAAPEPAAAMPDGAPTQPTTRTPAAP